MGKLIDLTGQRFGRLEVIQRAPNQRNKTFWLCQCDCGQQKEICGNLLKTGNTKSCGCLNREKLYQHHIEKIQDKRFGSLIAIEPTDERKDGKIVWKCQCDCGALCYVISTFLTQGRTQSCGCLQSTGEQKIELLLQNNNISYQKQKTFNTCKNPDTGYPLRFDFYLPDYNILIEYDGIQHYKATGGWSSQAHMKNTQIRDSIKNQWCKDNNIKLIRIPYIKYNDLTINDLIKGE